MPESSPSGLSTLKLISAFAAVLERGTYTIFLLMKLHFHVELQNPKMIH